MNAAGEDVTSKGSEPKMRMCRSLLRSTGEKAENGLSIMCKLAQRAPVLRAAQSKSIRSAESTHWLDNPGSEKFLGDAGREGTCRHAGTCSVSASLRDGCWMLVSHATDMTATIASRISARVPRVPSPRRRSRAGKEMLAPSRDGACL